MTRRGMTASGLFFDFGNKKGTSFPRCLNRYQPINKAKIPETSNRGIVTPKANRKFTPFGWLDSIVNSSFISPTPYLFIAGVS
jgi:hypothetical protein